MSATVRVGFVAAARFLGGQLLVSFANEIDPLPEFCEWCGFHFHAYSQRRNGKKIRTLEHPKSAAPARVFHM